MAKLQPFRDETLKDAAALRLRLNELVTRVNEASPRSRCVRVHNVQTGMDVVLPAPGFTVGGVVMGGVKATDGGSAPTTPPWVDDWSQLGDGRITFTVGGLNAAPALYAVSVVLHELEGS